MAKRNYKNGYQEKIQYWTEQLNKAIANNEVHQINKAMEKLQYFTQRHTEKFSNPIFEELEYQAGATASNRLFISLRNEEFKTV